MSPPDSTTDDLRSTMRKQKSFTYMENGTRWMEKQEARSLRQALHDMDLAEEKRIHRAAQDEAADLVWQHQNKDRVYRNPDYRAHLRKGSYNNAHVDAAIPAVASRSSSGSSQHSVGDKIAMGKRKSAEMLRRITPPSFSTRSRQTSANKPYGELAEMVRRDISSTRRTSSGSHRIMSGSKKGFMHPEDKIYEDEQESKPFPNMPELKPSNTSPLPNYTRKNPFARVRMQHEKLERANSAPLPGSSPRGSREEIRQRGSVPALGADILPASSTSDRASRDSIEIRSDEIRAATSKRRSDRSPALPQPTIVSDQHQRPIVSFQQDMRLSEIRTEAEPTPLTRSSTVPIIPTINFSDNGLPGRPMGPARTVLTICVPDEDVRPSIPTICFPDEEPSPARPNIPTICLPGNDEPSARPHNRHYHSTPQISVNSPAVTNRSTRPLPVPQQGSPRPKSTPHYSPSARNSGVLCAQCALPIAGRILSAAGERFHPGCFVCNACNTNLELVAFYPEPEAKRQERVERVHARQYGHYDYSHEDEATALAREADDGDESLRFYCHLDFHELFSPRCKSCKTPIEGEVIVACGAEWHAGHFFCAQCGDPFDSTTPFVEKEGYAWCVGCHTNRYSSKCRKCKKPVTDVVVKALDADWHSQCFCCTASGHASIGNLADRYRNATGRLRMGGTSFEDSRGSRSASDVKSAGSRHERRLELELSTPVSVELDQR